jgi:F0F1-type ATP synthase assembly protein I
MKPITPQESIAEAMRWVSRITSIGMSVALPTLCGYGVDVWQGTTPWGVVVGGLLGALVGLQQVVLLAKALAPRAPSNERHPGTKSNEK